MKMLSAIDFMGTPVSIIDHNGKRWLLAEEAGVCLGYAKDQARKGIVNLYNRHADEFTEEDTCVIKLMTQGQMREVRAFSDTGCIKLGFFANTARSKDFRSFAAKVLAAKNVTPEIVQTANTAAMDILARSMSKLADGMDTLLRQNNRTDRYVALLEMNQQGHVKVTEEIRKQVFELYGQGTPQASIARLLRISKATVNQLIKGTYLAKAHIGAPSYAEAAAVEVVIEQQLSIAREAATE